MHGKEMTYRLPSTVKVSIAPGLWSSMSRAWCHGGFQRCRCRERLTWVKNRGVFHVQRIKSLNSKSPATRSGQQGPMSPQEIRTHLHACTITKTGKHGGRASGVSYGGDQAAREARRQHSQALIGEMALAETAPGRL